MGPLTLTDRGAIVSRAGRNYGSVGSFGDNPREATVRFLAVDLPGQGRLSW